MTKVIHIRHAPKDWRSNPDYVYIGRPGKWGNPYQMKVYGREKCIEFFANSLSPELTAATPELRGKILVCYCNPEACHGDVLARLADSWE
jgi:hypothetical protein